LWHFTDYFAVLYHHHRLRDLAFYIGAKIWPDVNYLIALYGKPKRSLHLRQFLHKLR